jgi:hypothetical protein
MLKQVRSALIAVHLYCGLALCLLFVTWFVSGVAMVYYRPPAIADTPRLSFAEAFAEKQLVLPPAAMPTLAADWDYVDTLRLAQWRGRPLYRWRSSRNGWQSAWADTGRAAQFDAAALEPEARRWLNASRIRYLGSFEADHQWSYFSAVRGHYPLHKFATDGLAADEVLLSSRTGEVVVATTLASRLLYYLGPGVHYFSFYPIRNNEALWRALVNWSSGIGAIACLIGLILGLWRLRWAAVSTERTLIPYTKFWMYWHHWLGLAFGLFTFTFVLSGLFSMNPGKMFPLTSVPETLNVAYRGPKLSVDSVPALDSGAMTLMASSRIREYEYRQIRGQQFLLAISSPQDRQLLEWQGDNWRIRPAFLPVELIEKLSPVLASPIAGAEWLTSFDNHYYARKERHQPLPALRVRLNDSQSTWYYLEPASGALFLRSDTGTRARRWLYNGLHSLDFPMLLDREPVWHGIIWLLSLCGLALSIGSAVVSWQWLQRWAARRRRRGLDRSAQALGSSGGE